MRRQRHLIAYDIRDPKRLRRVAKTMEGFGIRMQYSVFVCDLTSRERFDLFTALDDVIDRAVDCVAAVELGDANDRRTFTFLGPAPALKPSGPVIL